MELSLKPLSAEERLHLQAQLLDTVGLAVLAIDLKGRIVYWNSFAEKLYGWTEDEVQGHDVIEVLATPLFMKSVRSHMDELENGKGWSGQFQVKRQDGSIIMSHLSASLIQNKRALISITGISSGNTERQQLQEANRLLAQASALLIDNADYEISLSTLAKMAVPQLSDWCAVHLLQPDGSIDQVALAPSEVKFNREAYDWLQNKLPNDDIDGLPAVFRSRRPKLITKVDSNTPVMAAIRSYMIVPLIGLPQVLGAITLVTAESGRHFDQNALDLAENLASHIALYLEKSRLFRESQRMNSELEEHVNERTVELHEIVSQLKISETMVQTLFRISTNLNSTLDIDFILDELAQESTKIVNGESGFAGLRTVDGMVVDKYFCKGETLPFKHTWPSGQGIPGWVLQHKISYGTSDALNDPIIQGELAVNKDVRSIICTPILDSTGEVLAYFNIHNKKDGEGFTIRDQELLMALAPVASIAIQNALAYQQRLTTVSELKESSKLLRALAASIELAREEERTQIARELHDQLGQALTAMKFDLAWLTNQLIQKDTTLSQKTKEITKQMDVMIKTVRRISTELRPGMMDDLGLADSIEWQARNFEKRTSIVCSVIVPVEALSLSRAKSLALFRIFQEALTNISRHAKAQQVDVELTATFDVVTLKLHDDGRGIKDQEITNIHSLGLLGMKERANQLGGTFEIQGVPGDGTIVTVSIPINEQIQDI